MEYQDLNLKRQIFSKDSIKGELITDKTSGFYLAGTSSGIALRGVCFCEHNGEEYLFWIANKRICFRAKVNTKGEIIDSTSLSGIVSSAVLSQTISSVTHLPNNILINIGYGKAYFRSSNTGDIMEFDYDFDTHTFTFVQIISGLVASNFRDFSYLDNGNIFVVYTTVNVVYRDLSTPYNLSTAGSQTTLPTSILCASRPYFFNEGKSAYYYQFTIGSGQFDFCVGNLLTPYRIETGVKRYGVAFNRASWAGDFVPAAYPFSINEERSILSVPCIHNSGKAMTYATFTVNGKFNKNLNITIL